MNVTFFHWGIHGWIVYVVVGLLLAFLCYRKDLPMTMRSCFYPLLGDKIYGWMSSNDGRELRCGRQSGKGRLLEFGWAWGACPCRLGVLLAAPSQGGQGTDRGQHGAKGGGPGPSWPQKGNQRDGVGG